MSQKRRSQVSEFIEIVHYTPGRIRLRFDLPLTASVRNYIEVYLREELKICEMTWYSTTRTLVLRYAKEDQKRLLSLLKNLSKADLRQAYQEPVEEPPKSAYETIRRSVVNRFFYQLLCPKPIRQIMIIYRTGQYIAQAIDHLSQKKLTVEVLDAAALTASVLRGQLDAASSIHFLLKLSDDLEENTLRGSYHNLKSSLALSIDRVWKWEDGEAKEVMASQVDVGDVLVINKGNLLPFDGRVHSGHGAVNEASLTGESFPVHKRIGDEVYANTVLQEGELLIEITRKQSETAIARLVDLITESDAVKSSDEKMLEVTANRLVKYNFLGLFLTYLLTRNIDKALSFLLVDFSCALRLIGPLNYLTAIKDAADMGIVIKGSKFIEHFDDLDTFVFDKTGTLTTAMPEVTKVIPLNGWPEKEVIRIGACLEEHFHHPIADAMVRLAEEKDIEHEEMHSDINYIVAHGIESSIDDKRVVIGSKHFIIEDEGVPMSEAAQEVVDAYETEYNLLYLAYDGHLIAIFCIDTAVRYEAEETLARLKDMGKRIILLTGDQENRAKAFAEQFSVDFDAVYSQVLPEDKYKLIEEEQAKGHKVAMIGDGINDSAALSLADTGIVLKETSELARQVSDIVLSTDDLRDIFPLMTLSRELQERLKTSQRFILGFNGSLIAAGLFNLLSPNTIAYLHNYSTFGMAFYSLRPFRQSQRQLLESRHADDQALDLTYA